MIYQKKQIIWEKTQWGIHRGGVKIGEQFHAAGEETPC